MSTIEKQNKIPLCDLKAQHEGVSEEIRIAVEQVLQSCHFIMGPPVGELETQVADYCGTEFAVGCSSGSDALLMALMALDIGPGDEVVTTPFTFFATAGAIARLGASPVFVDIEPDGFNLDPNLIKAAISARTKAIIPVHLFGQMAEMDPIMEIAKEHNLFVVEDACQAIGAEYYGRRAGSVGDIGCFSFFPSKNLGGIGDGGMVTTSDPVLHSKLRALRTHGTTKKYYHEMIGGNFRLDTIQAAVLVVKLRHLDAWNSARREAASVYRQLFLEAEIPNGVLLQPIEQPNRMHVYNQFCVRVPMRERLAEFLREQGVSTAVYYPKPLHQQGCFRELPPRHLPFSEEVSRDVLALPMSPNLSIEQQRVCVELIKKFLQE